MSKYSGPGAESCTHINQDDGLIHTDPFHMYPLEIGHIMGLSIGGKSMGPCMLVYKDETTWKWRLAVD